jgi:hypothetical protein
MRTQILTATIVAFNLALVALAGEQKQGESRSGCTTANVAGVYGYVGFGTVRVNSLGLPPGAYSSVGTLSFDGKGNLVITDTARIDDVILPLTVYPSTYTVDQQCGGTFTLSGLVARGIPGPHYKVVFVDNRHGIRAISLLPGLTVNYVNTTRIENGKHEE